MSVLTQWTTYGGVLMLVLASLALSGCGSSQEIELGTEADGSQIELAQGQTLAITLDSNPTTGFGWAQDPAHADETLVQVGDPEYQSKASLPGGGGIETLRFRGKAPGKTTLKLIYRRPWEKDAKPAETYTLEVSVH